jgi:CheY-like chemotaxis protein
MPLASAPPIVLVVDDDDPIRQLVTEILTSDLGLRVLKAANVQQALAVLENGASLPSLAMVDVRLGDSEHGGLALMHLLRKRVGPTLALMVFSALPADQAEAVARRVKAQAVMPKPFELPYFIEEVQRLLAPTTGDASPTGHRVGVSSSG